MKVPFDIETIPQQPEEEAKIEIAKTITAPAAMKKQETIDAWHNGDGKYAGEKEKAVEEAYRKTSFDAAKGQICSISWAVEDEDIENCAAYGNNSETDVLKYFFDSLLIKCERHQRKGIAKPYFIGHYIGGFDLKFVWQRAVILGVKPPFPLPFDGWHGSDFFCTQSAWVGKKGGSISMDNLAKALGIQGKGDMDGSKVWDEWKAGNYEKVTTYNDDDVEILRKIYERLTFGGWYG